eukprot:scaffold246787_cov17-Tisochrysis_lutea.AAC.1
MADAFGYYQCLGETAQAACVACAQLLITGSAHSTSTGQPQWCRELGSGAADRGGAAGGGRDAGAAGARGQTGNGVSGGGLACRKHECVWGGGMARARCECVWWQDTGAANVHGQAG